MLCVYKKICPHSEFIDGFSLFLVRVHVYCYYVQNACTDNTSTVSEYISIPPPRSGSWQSRRLNLAAATRIMVTAKIAALWLAVTY